jgi:hypothetical protein
MFDRFRMFSEKYPLVICVYACATVDKYRDQIRNIWDTWGKLCNVPSDTENIEGIPDNIVQMVRGKIKMVFFLGEEPTTPEFVGDEYVYLPGVQNDYLSASYKQNAGMKWLHYNYSYDFIMAVGTDTYLNIPKLLRLLDTYSPNDNLYIGGHGCVRNILNNRYYFHSGGAGFILTRECMRKYVTLLDGDIVGDWVHICSINTESHCLYGASDVAIAFYLQQSNINATIVTVDGCQFLGCNYLGYPCHTGQINVSHVITCHLMSAEDFKLYTGLLLMNNFYL